MTLLLEALGVSAGYGEKPVVQDVSLAVHAGEALAIVGPNAAGKSTLLRALAGAMPLKSGQIRVRGDQLETLPPRERARRIALVPQSARWDLDFSVREMVALGRAPHAGPWGLESPGDAKAIDAALAFADVASLVNRAFSELSGGERQRVLLARALAQEAPLMLLDEPTAHLDLGHQLLVLDRVRAHVSAGGGAIVVLHDLALAARLDRVAVLERGRLVALGKPAEVLTPERLAMTWGVAGSLSWTPDGPALLVRGRA